MIFLLEQALRTTVTDINFIERYGGIVQAVSRVRENGVDIFPVSRYVSVSDCFDNGRYRDLVPDDSYKSVAYWEQRGSSEITPIGPKGLLWRISQTMRLVCWLNLAKMGLTDYDAVDQLELYAIKAIHGQSGDVNTSLGYKFSYNVISFRTVPREAQAVFKPYSYQDQQQAYFWPNGFFAVDFTIRAELAAGCIVEPELGAEISCIQTW